MTEEITREEKKIREEIAKILEEKFQKKAPFIESSHWRWKEPRKTETPCSKCKATTNVWCLFADSGGPLEFHDENYHICLECGHIDHQSARSGSVGYEEHADCPFCMYRWE